MRLYHHPASSSSRRVTLAALHMGTPLELTEVNLMSQEDRRRLVLLNPNNKVPVLQDGDFTLWESCAIMQYLADRTHGQTLYPDNILIRADINRWMLWTAQHFAPPLGVIVYERIWKGLTGNGGPDEQAIARAGQQVAQFAAVLEQHLAGRDWIVGEQLTLADLAIAPSLTYIEQAQLPVMQYPKLKAWLGRVAQLDAWRQTTPVW
ncbi:glutathione S-transferase family protein [Duganella sp. FT80W]|uniref:Glutathione S-transferase family protein n=1 Tax=Duganella guangzhouensis TaxID=2666084 RepID=A0A6I2L6P8_9BURK|nr:glutathione S-transferase family protein [Duganella guangzhouensis]MRW93440.1 glutathione S-transferase family protein [Duganella guangzhouensis]